MKNFYSICILLLTFCTLSNAQEFNMPSNGETTITDCTGTIYDDGGPTGDYSNGANGTLIIDPPGDFPLTITIEELNTENIGSTNCYDQLYLYDGVNTGGIEFAAPGSDGTAGWCWDLNDNPPDGTGNLAGMSFTAESGALTLVFVSDGSVTRPGFVASYVTDVTGEIPTVGFSYDELSSCTGVFDFSSSVCGEGEDYTWDFGDGNTSTDISPSHTYTDPGTYTVSIEVCNALGCGEFSQEVEYDPEAGICFEFNIPTNGTETISVCTGTVFDSGGPDGNYSTGENGVMVIDPVEGDLLALTFDFLQIGFFDFFAVYDGGDINSPLIWDNQSGGTLPNNGETILSSGEALTIQFNSDIFSTPQSGWSGSFECITVDEPPQAAFSTSPPYSCDGAIIFIDETLFPPDTWEWNFGDGNTSDEPNPVYVYQGTGDFEVSLTVCNGFGCTTETQTVTVYDGSASACVATTIPTNGQLELTTCLGTLYDSGGPDGSYNVNDMGSVVIGNDGADLVTLSFTQFNLAFDNVNIYDGPNTSSPLLGSFGGTFLPLGGNAFESSGSYLTVEFVGAQFGTPTAGFQAYWTISSSDELPVADFESDYSVAPFNSPVQFTDLSTNNPTAWVWDFGDGNTSFAQNPVHEFTEAGQFEVTLIAINCSGQSESKSSFIEVQDPALIVVAPSVLSVELESGETLDTLLTLTNFGVGDLTYNITGFENTYAGVLQVLVYDFDSGNGNDVASRNNVLEIMEEDIFGLNVFSTNTTDPAALELELENMDVLLILGKSGTIDASVMSDLSPVIQDFNNNGGGVVFTASQINPDAIFNAGIFEGSYGMGLNNPQLEMEVPTHPLAFNVNSPFEGKSGCANYNITNADKQSMIIENDLDVMTLLEEEDGGRAILLGFNYLFSNDDMKQLLVNSILYAADISDGQWLFLEPTTGTVGNFETNEVGVSFDATNTPAGVYDVILAVNTNDPSNPVVYVIVQMTVTGTPQFAASTDNLDFGNVVQFTQETLTFTIVNTGSDTLFIFDIIPGYDAFEVDTTNFFVYPGLTQIITVTYSPQIIELLEDIPLTIDSNVGEFIILMNANATGAPVAGAIPDPIEVTVDYGGSTATILTVTNTGQGFLDYDLVNGISVGGGEFEFAFQTDNFATEFFWQLLDGDGNVIQESMPGDYTENNTAYTEILTGLEPCQSYTLFLQDTFGDGGLNEYQVTNLGSGEVVATGNFANGDSEIVDLGENISAWLSIDNTNGELPFPDGAEDINLSFDPGCLLGGVYTTTITMTTNDPLNPIIVIPVIMTVVGIPEISVEYATQDENTLDFGSILVGLDNSIEITISNSGTDSLQVSEFDFGDAQFAANFENVSLAPGEEVTVTITFTPEDIGNFDNTLTIINNDEDIVITILGDGQGAPSASTSMGSIDIEMQSGDIDDLSLEINNNGQGPMDYSITVSPENNQGPTVTVTPEDGLIDFPDLSNIEINIDATDVMAGVYIVDLIISTNDPANPEIIVPITISVSAFPQAAFVANNDLVVCGDEAITFTDQSVNVPTSWLWDFGDGNTSDDQSPSHSYSETGSFTVTLVVSNQVGSDTTTFQNFIEVDFNCIVTQVPANNGVESVSNCNGKVFDSGGAIEGPVGNYTFNNDGILTISPTDAVGVTLDFVFFDYADISDTLYIYDGPDTDSPILGAYTGTSLPNGGSISSTGPSITLKEATNGFLGFSGFEAFFSCIKPDEAPVAAFSSDPVDECSGMVQFTDESSLFPTSWDWNFGDGNSATSSNPEHQYMESGSYTVTLVASNSSGSSESEMSVEVFVFSPEITIPESSLLEETVQFIGETGDGYAYSWDFGDGLQNSNVSPEHDYDFEMDTIVTVTVTVTNTNIGLGCNAIISQELALFLEEPMDTMPTDTMVDTMTSLINAIDYRKFNVYPNPAGSFVNIELELNDRKDLQAILTEVSGKILFTDKISNTSTYTKQFDLGQYPEGIYFLRLIADDRQLVKRIVIQR